MGSSPARVDESMFREVDDLRLQLQTVMESRPCSERVTRELDELRLQVQGIQELQYGMQELQSVQSSVLRQSAVATSPDAARFGAGSPTEGRSMSGSLLQPNQIPRTKLEMMMDNFPQTRTMLAALAVIVLLLSLDRLSLDHPDRH